MVMHLSTPADQDRLNAALFELIQLRFNGAVWLPGDCWDCACALRYIEARSRRRCARYGWVAPDGGPAGGGFLFGDKRLLFTERGVLVKTSTPRPPGIDQCCADL